MAATTPSHHSPRLSPFTVFIRSAARTVLLRANVTDSALVSLRHFSAPQSAGARSTVAAADGAEFKFQTRSSILQPRVPEEGPTPPKVAFVRASGAVPVSHLTAFGWRRSSLVVVVFVFVLVGLGRYLLLTKSQRVRFICTRLAALRGAASASDDSGRCCPLVVLRGVFFSTRS
uniref:Uncharacterized protein n=1 Tax=Plectus sambesii TaxID=2011161 RepID=A0A914XGF0_9BILA